MRAGHPLQLAVGPAVWGLWLVAVYAGQALGCLLGAAAGPDVRRGLNVLLGAATLCIAAGLLWQAWRLWRASPSSAAERFVARTGAALDLFAALATLFVGLPIAELPPCV